ncbi:zinc finger CCCH domain-containing protein 10 [Neodiprion pinetum]|uniref:Zinc finger CCCH domain-containing protein 10 n=1 Tax=Neodiprion lecontei TaxID=441921 RepID=A0A6J0B4V9_NEOLC|nr:zinc finger CCCH domain-containing protein 10 [Neodiprion lecontei]XP_046424114.1 zinc finger CCCH domain-containing protein 10-like [Neodiprion fabricii]XP_046479693.1 zinc finger CCCH domain-containing protein 10-like [Neodiprion pinetum]XP_046617779.1 zinc finger CCCH domain-containing protein 10-like [Neodiprion virginianus]
MAGGSSSNGDSSPSRVCRDFLRNVCHRGKRCKYLHERSEDDPADEYTFCHDFQNGICNWPGCRFLHCTESEEKHFRATGELPPRILSNLKCNNDKSELPLCKDFIKGSCQRVNCKYRHYKKEEPQHPMVPPPHHTVTRPQHNFNGVSNGENRRYEEERSYHWQMEDPHPLVHNNGYNPSTHPPDYLGPPEAKRRIVSGETILHFETSPLVGQHPTQPVTSSYYYPVIPRNEARAFNLEDENALLKKKIEELKKQVNDLTATNEFLLDQNAQLRMSGKRTTNVTAVTVPAVTITNTVPPSQAPTPQQMVNAAVAAGTLRTVTASVATVPVSIATVTPVSIAAVSMAPVSIPPPIVTMAQQTISMSGSGPQPTNQQAPNAQQPTNLPLSISGPTAPLVSYPIMTQELRPVLQ